MANVEGGYKHEVSLADHGRDEGSLGQIVFGSMYPTPTYTTTDISNTNDRCTLHRYSLYPRLFLVLRLVRANMPVESYKRYSFLKMRPS